MSDGCCGLLWLAPPTRRSTGVWAIYGERVVKPRGLCFGNVVRTGAGGSLNHLFGIDLDQPLVVARMQTFERRPIHPSKVEVLSRRLPLQGPARGRSVRRHQPLSVLSSSMLFLGHVFLRFLPSVGGMFSRARPDDFVLRPVRRVIGLSTLQDRRHQAQQPAGHRHDRLFGSDTDLQPLVDPFPAR